MPSRESFARRSTAPASNRQTSITWRRTERERNWATRSRCVPPLRFWPRVVTRTVVCWSDRSRRTSGTWEAAAGIAGLIKTVLALQHGRIPPHLHFEQPNPHIPWDQLPVDIVTRPVAWPAGQTRIAGVSAFGMSGTNAHVVLGNAPQPTRTFAEPPVVRSTPKRMICLSARSEDAVRESARRHGDWIEQTPDVDLDDVCYSLGAARRHFEHRAAMIVGTKEQAIEALDLLHQGGEHAELIQATTAARPKVAWQFTGQGSQYVGMAHTLYQTEPVFRENVG